MGEIFVDSTPPKPLPNPYPTHLQLICTAPAPNPYPFDKTCCNLLIPQVVSSGEKRNPI